mmetsp:Transcript_12471/g.37392  ORF Transcript_12471/g.37392 Transcript_12471/m.37392 type:complete len:205 (-) Transcript_12471:596-1210(-)
MSIRPALSCHRGRVAGHDHASRARAVLPRLGGAGVGRTAAPRGLALCRHRAHARLRRGLRWQGGLPLVVTKLARPRRPGEALLAHGQGRGHLPHERVGEEVGGEGPHEGVHGLHRGAHGLRVRRPARRELEAHLFLHHTHVASELGRLTLIQLCRNAAHDAPGHPLLELAAAHVLNTSARGTRPRNGELLGGERVVVEAALPQQ